MKAPIGLLVLHGDGSRVTRLTVPRTLMYGVLGFIGLAAGTLAAGQYLSLKLQAGQLSALREEVSEQRTSLDSFRRRLVAVRGEIDSWKEVHARMLEPYGADPDAGRDGSTANEPRKTPPPATSSDAPASIDRELDLLTTSINEESPRLKELERVTSRTARIVAALPLSWPAKGKINSEFGVRKDPWDGATEHHGGIDIDVPLATPVTAPAPGLVVLAGSQPDYGNCVSLDHGNDVRSLYGHLSKILVKAGDRVAKGQVIGLSGSTGRSTGPHLHYEVRVSGRTVNPHSFLWE